LLPVFGVRLRLWVGPGMVRGIVQSAVFMLVLTRGVFERPFILFEVRTAVLLKKKIVMVRAV
jgi:hypothetical protein